MTISSLKLSDFFIISLLMFGTTLNVMAAQSCHLAIPDNNPAARYTVNGDGTITDEYTGLMWKQCSEGQGEDAGCTGLATTYTWKEALEAANIKSFATHNDWRVPNVDELESLATQNCYAPAINLNLFPNTSNVIEVWTSSPARTATKAWRVNFNHGDAGDSSLRTSSYNVRLVRFNN